MRNVSRNAEYANCIFERGRMSAVLKMNSFCAEPWGFLYAMKSVYYIALSQLLLQTAVAQCASVHVMFGDYNTRQVIGSVWPPQLWKNVL